MGRMRTRTEVSHTDYIAGCSLLLLSFHNEHTLNMSEEETENKSLRCHNAQPLNNSPKIWLSSSLIYPITGYAEIRFP
jgi:hypothetical protein